MLLRLALSLALALPLSAAAANLEIVRVIPSYRPDTSFQRLAEFFTGREYTGGTVILRTQPAQRGGYYFLVRVKGLPGAEAASEAVLELIAPTSPEKQVHRFPVRLREGGQVLLLGLTGADWHDPTAHPVAWRIAFIDSSGNLLAQEKSFLWDPS